MMNSPSQAKLRATDLRDQYPEFVYESVSTEIVNGELSIGFEFSAGSDIHFAPMMNVASPDAFSMASVNPRLLRNLAFHLGLIEMLSYWKATCSPHIVIRAGFLGLEQVDWWKRLLIKGMGEFFYVNQVDFTAHDFVDIRVAAEDDVPSCDSQRTGNRILVLASGGKDSALTLQLLREAGADFNCLMLNPLPAALALVKEAGCDSPIIVKRAIDPRLLELNRLGYLNGHTPFSALLSFLGVTCALLFDYESVIVSNERSSNEGNVEYLGAQVNHQYSKTFDFEQRFRDYSRKYLSQPVEYFSLLRPLYEIQIAQMVSQYPRLLPVFKSCNRNQLAGTWCGSCPKCISVFTLFYPFLSREDLVSTFGRNYFESESCIPLLKELAGTHGHKPFECVGTHDETITALHLASMRARREHGEPPVALQFVEREILPLHPGVETLSKDVLCAWSAEHNLPVEYERLLRRRIADAGGG